MKKWLLVICLSLCFVTVFAAGYQGKVYIDSNKNGLYDKGERVLKNVMVSDGYHVVKTNTEGVYTLSGYGREKFIFITIPSGYKTSEYYKKIEAGVEDYDFAVYPYDAHVGKNGEHKFIHVSDTEISNSAGQEDWVNNLYAYADNENLSFIIHTGDICYAPGLKSHKPMMNTENMEIPVYYCIGNHDLVKGSYGEELFESIYGPVYYSFNVGNTHYVVTPMWRGDYMPSYTKEDIYYWLKNDLENIPAGMPIVIFNHDYWTSDNRHVFSVGAGREIDLDAYNLKAWIYGHVHINHITKHGKVLAICTSTLARGGIDHATSAFRTIHVDSEGDISSELRYTYIDKSMELPSVQNGSIPITDKGEIPISVNVYSTQSPVRKVCFSLALDGKFLVYKKELKQHTDFNWLSFAKLPDDCVGKFIKLSAEADFANGEKISKKSFFKYNDNVENHFLGGNWDNLLGNAQHTGKPCLNLNVPYSLTWINNMGSNVYMTSPLVVDSCVYCATVDDNFTGNSAVVCVDALNGEIIWKYATRSSVKNSIASTQGIIFAQDVYGYLYALDAISGKLLWEKKLNVVRVPGLNDGLMAEQGMVYAGSGKGLCAIEAKTGRVVWENKDWSQGEGTTSTLSLCADNHVVIGGVQWGAMYANDADNGRLLWSRSSEGIRNRASSPAIYGDNMYFLSLNSLFILSCKTGELIMQKKLPYSVDVSSTPLVTDKEIIFGTAAEGLVALHRNTLEEKWKFRTGKALIYTSPYSNEEAAQIESSPVLCGNSIVFGASDGVFYAIDREKGQLQWRHRTGAPILSTIAVSGNMFFGVDFSGNLYGFTGRTDSL